jgi:hypothetical protein
MCYECGCWGSVTPYGVGGRDVKQPTKKATISVPPKFDRPKADEKNYEKRMKK